jgi:hypothetical protein
LYDLECKLFSFYFQNRVSCEFVSDIDKLNTASVVCTRMLYGVCRVCRRRVNVSPNHLNARLVFTQRCLCRLLGI